MEDGPIRARALLVIGVVAAVVIGIVVVRHEVDVRRRQKLELAAQQADLALYRQLPLYPGAVEYRRFTTGIYSCEDCALLYYTTTIEYQLADAPTTSKVFDFYASRVPAGWQMEAIRQDCAAPTSTTVPTTPTTPSTATASHLAAPTTAPGSGQRRACEWSTSFVAADGQIIYLRVTVADGHGARLDLSRQ